MRRKDREITDSAEIARIMSRCRVANIAFAGESPYVIPMNFGFTHEDGHFVLYMHGAGEGEKIRRMKADPHVAFSMFTDDVLLPGEIACRYTADFDSVCGDGVLAFVEEEEKRFGLTKLMDQFEPGKTWTFEENMLRRASVLRLDVRHISGKRHKTLR